MPIEKLSLECSVSMFAINCFLAPKMHSAHSREPPKVTKVGASEDGGLGSSVQFSLRLHILKPPNDQRRIFAPEWS